MPSYMFAVEGKLPGLNEYTGACRSNPHAGAAMKKKAEKRVLTVLQDDDTMPKNLEGAFITFRWFEPTRRRDKDNIAFAKKFLLDAMVTAGMLTDDGWGGVAGFKDEFVLLDKDEKEEVRVEVYIET